MKYQFKLNWFVFLYNLTQSVCIQVCIYQNRDGKIKINKNKIHFQRAKNMHMCCLVQLLQHHPFHSTSTIQEIPKTQMARVRPAEGQTAAGYLGEPGRPQVGYYKRTVKLKVLKNCISVKDMFKANYHKSPNLCSNVVYSFIFEKYIV